MQLNARSLVSNIGALLGLLVLAVAISSLADADAQLSPWLSVSSPTLQKEFDLSSSETLPTTVAGLGNRDCDDMTVITRPSKLFQTQLTNTACFVRTTFGVAESNGLMRFAGASVAGTSTNYMGYSAGLIAIPSSLDFIHYTSAGINGLYLHFTRAVPGPLSVEVASSGTVNYRFVQPASSSLRDKAGTLLPAQTDSLSFSSNGKWMVVDSPGHAMLRVNVDTLDVLPFSPAFNYQTSNSPSAQTTISNDGRYAVVSSKNFSVFTLYDLDTCAAVPNSINAPVNCQFRNLLPYMQQQLSGYVGSFNLRFESDMILSLYGISNLGNGLKRAKFSLLAPGQIEDKVTYLGMGDSFSSGEGENLGGTYYVPGTDEENNLCHLSTRSYPYLISNSLAISDFHSVACSGAEIKNINGQDNPSNLQDRGTQNSSYWMPGTQLQIGWAEQNRPNFLTISIGGNNVGFANDIIECATSHLKIPLPNTCKYAADPLERGNVAKLIADQFTPLKNLYEELVKATNHKTKVYVVGYPEFVKGDGGSCGLNVRLNDQERQFVFQATHYMNQVVKAAASSAGVYYLDIENSLEGRNLCSIVSDAQIAVNGVTEGNDKHLPWWSGFLVGGLAGVVATQRLGIANESFHPNSNGQRLMYTKIMGLTNNDPGSYIVCPASPTAFVCKNGDSKVPLPDSSYFGADAVIYISNLNSSSPTPQTPAPQPITMVVNDQPLGRQLHMRLDYMLPNSSVSVINPSTNLSLGQYTVNQQGILEALVTIPSSVEAGFYSLHALGTNIAGEASNYFQSIFVPGPDDDINGNAVPDTNDVCGFTTASGSDTDFDGIDDACDGEIGPIPLPRLSITVRNLRVGP